MTSRYGIQHTDGTWWRGSNLWASHPIGARWFDTWKSAELAGLRELTESSSRWTVRRIPEPRESAIASTGIR